MYRSLNFGIGNTRDYHEPYLGTSRLFLQLQSRHKSDKRRLEK